MVKKIIKEKILELVRNKGLKPAQVREELGLSQYKLRAIISVKEIMSVWNEWARDEVESRYVDGQTFEQINFNLGWAKNKANSLFTPRERKALRNKRDWKRRSELIKDYHRGLTKRELRSKYDLSYPTLKTMLEGIEKPDLKHNVVPIIIDHYNGATIDDLSIKYDLDPVFIEKYIERNKKRSRNEGVVYYDMVVDYCINNMESEEISAKHGVSKQCLMAFLKHYGGVSHRENRISSIPTQDVVDAYESGQSISSIASTHHSSYSVIKNILLSNDVEIREGAFTLKQKNHIVSLYAQFKTAKQVGKECGTTENAVLRLLKKNGVKIRKSSEYKTNQLPVYLPREEIIALKDEGWTWDEIADKYGACSATVRNHANGVVKYNPKYHAQPKTLLTPTSEIIQAYKQGADTQEIMERFGDQIKKMVD